MKQHFIFAGIFLVAGFLLVWLVPKPIIAAIFIASLTTVGVLISKNNPTFLDRWIKK